MHYNLASIEVPAPEECEKGTPEVVIAYICESIVKDVPKKSC
jgi:hypothetical protein